MIDRCKFQTPIAPSYLRNNRSTRQKSLRCFPSCDPRGHINAGFCGIPLRVELKLSLSKSIQSDLSSTATCEQENFKLEELIFVAEIRPITAPRLSKLLDINENELYSQFRVKNDQNSKAKSDTESRPEMNKGELFLGEVEEFIQLDKSHLLVTVKFNAQHCSYDYAWKSNRWSGPTEQHVVDIIVFKPTDETSINYDNTQSRIMKVLSSNHSSPFVILSSHKKSGNKPVREIISKPLKTKKRPRYDEQDDAEEEYEEEESANNILSAYSNDGNPSKSQRIYRREDLLSRDLPATAHNKSFDCSSSSDDSAVAENEEYDYEVMAASNLLNSLANVHKNKLDFTCQLPYYPAAQESNNLRSDIEQTKHSNTPQSSSRMKLNDPMNLKLPNRKDPAAHMQSNVLLQPAQFKYEQLLRQQEELLQQNFFMHGMPAAERDFSHARHALSAEAMARFYQYPFGYFNQPPHPSMMLLQHAHWQKMMLLQQKQHQELLARHNSNYFPSSLLDTQQADDADHEQEHGQEQDEEITERESTSSAMRSQQPTFSSSSYSTSSDLCDETFHRNYLQSSDLRAAQQNSQNDSDNESDVPSPLAEDINNKSMSAQSSDFNAAEKNNKSAREFFQPNPLNMYINHKRTYRSAMQNSSKMNDKDEEK